jgi:hypothetical protein
VAAARACSERSIWTGPRAPSARSPTSAPTSGGPRPLRLTRGRMTGARGPTTARPINSPSSRSSPSGRSSRSSPRPSLASC